MYDRSVGLRLLAVLLLPLACDFAPKQVPGEGLPDGAAAPDGNVVDVDGATVDARAPGIDARELGDVVHLPPAAELAGTGLLGLTGGTLNTTDLTIDGAAPPAGVTFDVWEQDPDGPELAVLHVAALEIPSGSVRVVGARPLVIIASGGIVIDGTLDVSAHGAEPGAGGAGPGDGDGAGDGGGHGSQTAHDGGGGGAGFVTNGASGGGGGVDGSCQGATGAGGARGTAYATAGLQVLEGGSGGGSGAGGGDSDEPQCPSAGGAGGGAIQLHSAVEISIRGVIHVGGGGGEGGGYTGADPCARAAAGSGGGSGGAIYLQAPRILLDGVLAANGGAGGGGASNPGSSGETGDDGRASTTPAMGGSEGGAWGEPGGNGGYLTSNPQAGVANECDGNGGGGGGGVGAIVLRVPVINALLDTGVETPPATVQTY
jgi:hypothetical protein